MKTNTSPNFPKSALWWVAFTAQALAATLDILERQYVKAAGLYCLALCFLMLATGGTSAPARWRKLILNVSLWLSIGLLLYWLVMKISGGSR
jgi:threonine/homoserine/homoserine lactone efflux protein